MNTENSITQKHRILVGATGSVDIMMLPSYLQHIKKNINCDITVLMTSAAESFIPASTIALYCDRVVSGEKPTDWPTDKPSRLVADHDIIVVLPTTANTLSTVAHGGATNRLTTIILSSKYPVIFFPVMGEAMWAKKAVIRNVNQIREDGYDVIEPKWVENYDVSLKRMVGHPSIPDHDSVVNIIRAKLSEN